MKRFDDWSLRSKLWVSLCLVVAVVTLMMLIALVLNLRTLRLNAIPDQRVILTLSGLTFDYLSEIREYVVESDQETLQEIAEIEVRLAARLDEYRVLARGAGRPRGRDAGEPAARLAEEAEVGFDLHQLGGGLVAGFEDVFADLRQQLIAAGDQSSDRPGPRRW